MEIGRLLGACAVVAVVLVAFGTAGRFAARGRTSSGNGRLISIVETAFLPAAASLHVIRVAERYYAVGRSGAYIATLCEIPAESVSRRQPTRASPERTRRLWRRRA